MPTHSTSLPAISFNTTTASIHGVDAGGSEEDIILWDESPDHTPSAAGDSDVHRTIGFKSVAIAVCAARRLRHSHLRHPPPRPRSLLSRLLRVHVHVVVAIIRLSSTLPSIRRRNILYLHRLRDRPPAWPHHRAALHCFRSRAVAVLFVCRLSSILRHNYILCSPLQEAIGILSQASKIKTDQTLNAGKCKVLLHVHASIAAYLSIVRFMLDEIGEAALLSSNPSSLRCLSAFYYTLKDLCRCLYMCSKYIQDSTGSISSHNVFAKLESTDALKHLIIDLSHCHQRTLVKFEAFLQAIPDRGSGVCPEFTWDCMPPASPGLFLGRYLSIQAAKDLAQVVSNIGHPTKPFWAILWANLNKSTNHLLSAPEEEVLSKLLLARLQLNLNPAATTPLDSLKQHLFIDKKYVKPIRFLGIGSYGVVEEVVCFGEKYAMKTIKGVNSIENANEAVIQARLHHPNIVKLAWYTCNFDSQNSLSLLMDLMDMNLDTFIEQQMLSGRGPLLNYPLVALDIMMQIAKAMAYLHEESIMHRDLKAANVLLNLSRIQRIDGSRDDGYVQVKVADFGLAKSKRLGSESANTKKVGTKYWRAPEVFYYDRVDADYSFSADVYSFAMTCYEIITGKKPYADADQNGLKERIAIFHERPPLPSDLHPLLTHLIHQCWHRAPASRPTFQAVCHTLQRVKDDLTFAQI